MIRNYNIDLESRFHLRRDAIIPLIFFLVTLLTILSFSKDGYAGRPLTVDDAETLGKGENQIEIGIETFNTSGVQTEATFIGTYARGLTEKGMELTLGFPFSSVRPHGGATGKDIGDFGIELKAAVWDEGENYPAFTIKPAISFPTGDVDAGTGSGEIEYRLTAIFSKELGPLTAHFNIGISHGVESKHDTLFYGLAFEVPLTEKLSLVKEITLSDNLDLKHRDRPIETLFGLTYKLTEEIVLDFGVKFGLNDVSTDFGALAGATIAF